MKFRNKSSPNPSLPVLSGDKDFDHQPGKIELGLQKEINLDLLGRGHYGQQWKPMVSNELSKFRTIWYMGIPLYTTPCNCQRGRNELSKFRAIWYMGIPYIPHHVIVKPLKKCAQMALMLLVYLAKPWLPGIDTEIEICDISTPCNCQRGSDGFKEDLMAWCPWLRPLDSSQGRLRAANSFPDTKRKFMVILKQYWRRIK